MIDDATTIMRVDRARAFIKALRGDLFATCILWDADSCQPIYIGTAKSRGRLIAHLKKDAVRDGKIGHTHVNKPFHAYVITKQPGWFGMTIATFPSQQEMHDKKVELIGRFGLRANGGTLFNRRTTG